ncbi:hypothetical protein, partial [Pedobacter sp.]|uniref:hypothetical protein n=1 Tax=Pedobacter sp. TaxID=1411316 RepID=UPI003D7FFC57
MESHIPEQQEGSKMDIHAQTEFDSTAAAKEYYLVAKNKLMEVYRWYEVCEVPVSTFMLTDRTGNEVKRWVQEGDYLKIDIPGPGTSTGDGYDWVKVESIKEESSPDTEVTSITVRPASNPKNLDASTAHFFEDSATSTFQVKRIGTTVHAEVHGRNEKANTDTDQVMDNVR